MASIHQCRGDIGAAAHSYEVSHQFVQRLGGSVYPPDLTQTILGRLYIELGRYDESLSLLETLLARQRKIADYDIAFITEAMLSRLYLALGQQARAEAVLTTPKPGAAAMARRNYLVARVRLAMHRNQPAIDWADEALRVTEVEGGAYPRLNVQTFRARLLPPAEGAALARDLCAQASTLGQHIVWPLELAACDALRRSGQAQRAAEHARRIIDGCQRWTPTTFEASEYGWIASLALREAGDDAAADAALLSAARWIRDVALPKVPSPFRSSFLDRNPVNRFVLLAVQSIRGA